jgi:LysM repeat protein
MVSSKKAYIALSLAVLLASCARTIYGVYHKVQKNETLWKIAQTYNVDIQEIAEINDIDDPAEIETGQRIFIPGARRVLRVRLYPPKEEDAPKRRRSFTRKVSLYGL